MLCGDSDIVFISTLEVLSDDNAVEVALRLLGGAAPCGHGPVVSVRSNFEHRVERVPVRVVVRGQVRPHGVETLVVVVEDVFGVCPDAVGVFLCLYSEYGSELVRHFVNRCIAIAAS